MSTPLPLKNKQPRKRKSLVLLGLMPLLAVGGVIVASGKNSYYVVHGYEAIVSLWSSDKLPDASYLFRRMEQDTLTMELGFSIAEEKMTAGYVDIDSTRYTLREKNLTAASLSFRVFDSNMELVGTLNGAMADGYAILIYTPAFGEQHVTLKYVVVEAPDQFLLL